MNRSETIAELAKALSAFQGALTSAPKREVNPYFKSRYADLDAIWETIRKPLAANGLAVVQTTVEREGGMALETTLLHVSGEWISSLLPLYLTKFDPQSVGSAMTYARRYGMSPILGVSADDDDDAEAAMAGHRVAAPTSREPARPLGTNPPVPTGADALHFCAEHQTPWTKRTGRNGAAWWSHAIPNGGWCNMPSIQGVDDQADAADVPETAPGSPATPAQAPTAKEAAVLPEPPEIKNLGGLLTYGMALGIKSKAACLIAMGVSDERTIENYTEAAQTMYQFALRRASNPPVTP